MTSITIALDGARVARLREIADRRGQTVEQVIESLIETLLPQFPDSPDLASTSSTLDLAGIIADPTVKPLTAREIDELLAEEAGGIQHAAE